MEKSKRFSFKEFAQKLFLPLELLSFTPKTREEILEHLKQSPALSDFRKKSEGMKTCYQRIVNGKLIVVHTTWVQAEGKMATRGYGWVLLIDHRSKDILYSWEVRRTRRFFWRMMQWVKTFVAIAEAWPSSTDGQGHLLLVHTKGEMHIMEFVSPVTKAPEHGNRFPLFKLDMPRNLRAFFIGFFQRYFGYRQKEQNKHRQYRRILRAETKSHQEALCKQGEDDVADILPDYGVYQDEQKHYDEPYYE